MAVDDGGAHAEVAVSTDAEGHPLLCIAGELDISNVDAIEQDCIHAIATSVGRVVFDLAELSFIDSSGLAMLLRVDRQADELVIRHPSRAVQRIVEASGLSQQLRIEP